MEENVGIPKPEEAVQRCPICRTALEYNQRMGKYIIRVPVCLYEARFIKKEQKQECAYAQALGIAVAESMIVAGAMCDLCGREMPGSRYILNVHPEPEPNVDGMHVCPKCLKAPENHVLRMRQKGKK